jgi:hypothetical protein
MKPIALIFFALSWVLSGCTSTKESMRTAGPREVNRPYSKTPITRTTNAEEPAAPAEGPVVFPRVGTGAYFYVDEPQPTGYGAYAYVVLLSPASEAEKQRYQAICRAFQEGLPPTRETSTMEKRVSQMVTFWPVSGTYLGKKPGCDVLLDNYPYDFAASVAASVGKQGVKGPLLIASTTPYGEPNSKALVLDMSKFATNDFDRAFRIWRGRIAKDPEIWNDGWKAVVVKEEIRSAIENIGPGVVTVVATFFSKK